MLRSSGADSIGHEGACSLFLPMAGHGGTVSRKTANKKLAKLTITKASGGLTIVPIVPWHGGPR